MAHNNPLERTRQQPRAAQRWLLGAAPLTPREHHENSSLVARLPLIRHTATCEQAPSATVFLRPGCSSHPLRTVTPRPCLAARRSSWEALAPARFALDGWHFVASVCAPPCSLLASSPNPAVERTGESAALPLAISRAPAAEPWPLACTTGHSGWCMSIIEW
jgi:hypothetical protein